ncbi:hypothetical protein GCM10009765_31960 [Fodinicola feengrottensis]|uniref:Tetratricopeptide repeat protein n=1 Tax=Fodinicola feengrottensis TaxID=435914 RepID=A0ABP4T0M8_9ACTN
MDNALAKGWELMESGDVQGAMRELRLRAADIPPAEIAPLVERVARLADMPDLAEASAALIAAPDQAQQLYEYGYECVEYGASFLAVPALSAALALVPDARSVLVELASALEREERYGDAFDILRAHEPTLQDWPERYLLAFNALMTGDLEVAAPLAAAVPEPVRDDQAWLPIFARLQRIFARAAQVRPADNRDLRGWHYVLNGTLLTTLSPYGFDSGMTGRYAFFQESLGHCLFSLRRLKTILEAANLRPTTISLLADRSSQILGLAAAQVLDLPAAPYAPGRPDTLIVGYDLNEVDEQLLAKLSSRTNGEVLYEHASCWTSQPSVSADVCAMLVQSCVSPWGVRLRQTQDGPMERIPADDRPVEKVAAEIVAADPDLEDGDGETPPDPDETLATFAARLARHWPAGPRESAGSPGPVRSSRFT